MARKKLTKGQAKIKRTMHEFKHGTLHSGSKTGPMVYNRQQALAIAMNSGRKVSRRRRR